MRSECSFHFNTILSGKGDTDINNSVNSNKGSVTLIFPIRIPDQEKKINLNFYLRDSLWYFKMFCEGHTKKCENKNLS